MNVAGDHPRFGPGQLELRDIDLLELRRTGCTVQIILGRRANCGTIIGCSKGSIFAGTASAPPMASSLAMSPVSLTCLRLEVPSGMLSTCLRTAPNSETHGLVLHPQGLVSHAGPSSMNQPPLMHATTAPRLPLGMWWGSRGPCAVAPD